MDVLAAFRTFVRIAETGSFSAVAREAGTTQPAVSRQIAALEAHLGARLVQRSTRSLTLTEDGRALLERARHVIEAVEETEASVGQRTTAPSGLVRVGCPLVFGRTFIVPHLGGLLERYPDLNIDLHVGDDVVDIIHEGLDVSIRVGEITDGSLIARRLGETVALPVAAVSYLEKHGEPIHPSDLSRHNCVIFTRSVEPNEWRFTGPEGPVSIRVAGRLRTNSIEAVLASVVAGQGIARVPLWMMREPLLAGVVRPILRPWQSKPMPISAVYPSRRFLPPRTRAVIDYLAQEFRGDPGFSTYGATPPNARLNARLIDETA